VQYFLLCPEELESKALLFVKVWRPIWLGAAQARRSAQSPLDYVTCSDYANMMCIWLQTHL